MSLLKTNITLLILLCALLFAGCDTNKSNVLTENITHFDDLITFKAIDTLEMTIDTITNFHAFFLQRVEIDGIEYLAYENPSKPSIQLYNIGTEKLVNEVFLKKNGPNGITSLDGFYIHTQDSIFVLNGYLFNVFIMDRQGSVIKKYDLKKLLPNIDSDPVCYTVNSSYYDKTNNFTFHVILPIVIAKKVIGMDMLLSN